MDHGACNVVYLDRRARDEMVRRDSLGTSLAAAAVSRPSDSNQRQQQPGSGPEGYFEVGRLNVAEVLSNIETILSRFNQVHVCGSGATCLAKISELHASDAIGGGPTILLLDVPYDEEQRLKRQSREPRTPSPTFTRRPTSDLPEPDDIYGMHLLRHVSSEIQRRTMSRLVVPVVVLSGVDKELTAWNAPSAGLHGSQVVDAVGMVRYLDAGAVDVVTSPISNDSAHGLVVHAYRVYREVSREHSGFLSERQNRKLSWVGVDEVKPYAYLREAMVSGLMSGICNPESIGESLNPRDVVVEPHRRDEVARAIGCWSFSAHEFTDDELLLGALMMLQHALKVPELQQWRKSADELIVFLIASRKAYNDFVLYHNFRHVSDVLQAMFYFLVQIGTLPPYKLGDPPSPDPPSAIASLLKPFDALTLLVSAIGHDVGHPGVNNAFLVALNSPLAQLYNDRSVLESFHCAAYSQILRRYWPEAFRDMNMRKLMINSILATDMGLHFKYMADLGNLQEKLAHNNRTVDGWSGKVLEDYRDLACGLLIKCADISNVARKFDVAAQWASILTDEFSNQGNMEKELNMPTTLFGGPPERDDIIKMGESQIGFANIFARPLFEAVTDVIPAMAFSTAEILANKRVWESKIEAERERKARVDSGGLLGVHADMDGSRSPRSQSTENLVADSGNETGTRSAVDVSMQAATEASTAADLNAAAHTTTSTPARAPNWVPPASTLSVSSSSRPSSSSINSPAPFTQSDVTSRRSSSGATSFPVSRRCGDSGRPDSAAVDIDIDLAPFITAHRDSITATGRTSSDRIGGPPRTLTKTAPPRASDISSTTRPLSSTSSAGSATSTTNTPSIRELAERFSFARASLSHDLDLSLITPNGYTCTNRGGGVPPRGFTSETALPRSPGSSISPGTTITYGGKNPLYPAVAAPPSSGTPTSTDTAPTPRATRDDPSDNHHHHTAPAPTSGSSPDGSSNTSRRHLAGWARDGRLRHAASSGALPRGAHHHHASPADLSQLPATSAPAGKGDYGEGMGINGVAGERGVNGNEVEGRAGGPKFSLRYLRRRWRERRERENVEGVET